MDFLFTLIFLSLFMAMWNLMKKWLFSSADLSDREDD